MNRSDAIEVARKYGLVSNPEACRWLDPAYTLDQYLADDHFYMSVSRFHESGKLVADTSRPIPPDEKRKLWNRVVYTRAEIAALYAKDRGDSRPLHAIRDAM